MEKTPLFHYSDHRIQPSQPGSRSLLRYFEAPNHITLKRSTREIRESVHVFGLATNSYASEPLLPVIAIRLLTFPPSNFSLPHFAEKAFHLGHRESRPYSTNKSLAQSPLS